MKETRKSIDGFLPSDKNSGTFFTQSDGRPLELSKRGISSQQLLENDRRASLVPHDPASGEVLDLRKVVALPARNGNDLEINLPKQPAKTEAKEKTAEEPTKPKTTEAKEAREFLAESGLLNEDALDELAEELPETPDEAKDELELPKAMKTVEAPEDEPEELKTEDVDNDLGFDGPALAEYRTRHSQRTKDDDDFGVKKNIFVRVLAGIAILAVSIGASYLLFSLFYDAPTPAQPVEQAQPQESVAPEPEPPAPEAPASVVVYNAGTTEGAAAKLATELTSQGLTATAAGNLTNAGSGYTIYDLTGGKKPQAAAKLAELYGVTPQAITAGELPEGVQSGSDFVIIIH